MVEADIEVRRGVEYVIRDGAPLQADLYLPRGRTGCPALVCIHGGAWYIGSRERYRYWGPFLARRGYAVLAINYRLATNDRPAYPASMHDAAAAVRYLRSNAAALGIDPERIGAMGDSAGGHLAALVALVNDLIEPGATVSCKIKVCVPVYAVLDLVAQWEHDQLARPRDQITERYLGCSPMQNRVRFLEASPVTWTTTDNISTAFLVVWGAADDIVDHATQSLPFVTWLKRAGNYVRTVPLVEAPHYWIEEPLDDPTSYAALLAPRLLRFLADRL